MGARTPKAFPITKAVSVIPITFEDVSGTAFKDIVGNPKSIVVTPHISSSSTKDNLIVVETVTNSISPTGFSIRASLTNGSVSSSVSAYFHWMAIWY